MKGIASGALFGPETVSWRVLQESVLLIGGPRALLMQLAHPKVAAGVAEHTDFPADPFGRLRRTLEAMTTISFGSRRQARTALARIKGVHERVAGALIDGEQYRADDPELLLWVHATLIDTVLEVERRYLGRLAAPGREAFYEESRDLARAFEIPSALVPPDLEMFRGYVGEQVRALEVGDVARELARSILHPPVPLLPAPLWEPLRLVTVDMLPRPLREGYGLRWDANRKRLLLASQLVSRLLLPRVPAFVRTFPRLAVAS